MKRVICLLLLAVLLMGVSLLAGCRVEKFTVDPEKGTVSDGKFTYEYTDETTYGIGSVTRKITVRYPDGGIYLWEEYRGVQNARSNGYVVCVYDKSKYAYGDKLVDAIVEENPAQDIRKTGIYTEQIGDQVFEVNIDAQTITTNGYVFPYSFNGSTLNITYPDGSLLMYRNIDVSWGNANEDTVTNDGKPYADYHDLVSVAPWPVIYTVTEPHPQRNFIIKWPVVVIGALLIGVGVWMALKPRAFWYYNLGRWFKNAEPSDLALKYYTIGGYIEIVLGMLIVLYGILGNGQYNI